MPLPCEMTTLVMDRHLLGLVVVQFFPNTRFVFRGQSCPGLVGPPVVLVCWGHLDIVIELDYLKLPSDNSPSVSISLRWMMPNITAPPVSDKEFDLLFYF